MHGNPKETKQTPAVFLPANIPQIKQHVTLDAKLLP